MPNVALGKPIEETVRDAHVATNGQITGYTGTTGWCSFKWPGEVTVDLHDVYELACIRMLLFDGLGEGGKTRDGREYKYRLLTSTDHRTWTVIYATRKRGYNGWQQFNFPEPIRARYVRVHGLSNPKNPDFHIVELQAFDSEPDTLPLDAEIVVDREIEIHDCLSEIGGPQPIERRFELLIDGLKKVLELDTVNPEPFRKIISDLEVQVGDVAAIERELESIRRQIIDPVQRQLARTAEAGKYSVRGFKVGLVALIFAIVALGVSIWTMLRSGTCNYSPPVVRPKGPVQPSVKTIDISPTACRVMAKRLRDVCKTPESDDLWRIGRGFVVRDLPWTEEKLRKLPPFEFENWAVIALGGIPNKTQVGDMGIDGRIFPVGSQPERKQGELDLVGEWYPVQVKQKDKVGRPDIDSFEAVMRREDRRKGFFVAFDYAAGVEIEISRYFKQSGRVIIPLTVKDILEEELARKLA